MTTSALQATLDRLHQDILGDRRGEVADYIPELATANPEHFGIAVCGLDGRVSASGDAGVLFSIQSMCKPLLYAAALAEFGRQEVHKLVGVEPAGAAFDALIRLDADNHLPHNPMLNAGAIAISALLATKHDVEWLLRFFRRMAGREDIHVDMPVYLSERATADRNRAIAYLLRYFDGLRAPVDEALELYFQACSVLVDVRDLATIGATLANDGRSPTSGQELLPPETVKDVIAVMTTCGLYDGSGRFSFNTGLPAKSGVSGGVVAVAPRQMGIAIYSAPLDEHGNSVRGLRALETLSRQLDLHLFAPRKPVSRSADAPTEAPSALLDRAVAEGRLASGGARATYSESLATVDPELFGIALCAVDGTEYSAGDAQTLFSMQGTTNAFTYAMALERAGAQAVHAKVGIEPSGNPFYAIRLEPQTQRPYNPMGNAGAIAVASLLPGADETSRLKQLLAWFGDLAATERLPIHAGVLWDERRSGDRNRAIAHILRNVGVIDSVDPALDLYFQQCSVLINCVQLARMGATLAAGGHNPLTKKALMSSDTVRSVLSAMYMCGLHEASGRFAFEVGLPAKNGASGALVAVVPGRYGIAVYAPAIDAQGTSVRGAAALKSLARSLR